MKSSKLLICFLLPACIVEAGNPGDDKKPKGRMIINFAQTYDDSAKRSLVLPLESITLTSSEQAEEAPTAPTKNEIELYSSKKQTNVLGAELRDIPAGSYRSITFKLKDTDLKFRDYEGNTYKVATDSLEDRSFTLPYELEIIGEDEAQATVYLDPFRSLVAEDKDSDKLAFEPLAEIRKESTGKILEGETDEKYILVCAYRSTLSLAPADGEDTPPGADAPSTPDVKVGGNQNQLPNCMDADAQASVTQGKYILQHLVAGSYKLKFFESDGETFEPKEEIPVE
jgi:hypothetical protein